MGDASHPSKQPVVPELSEASRRAADESLDHAADLLDGARLLLPRHPHLAFHFAALSLEEVGRSTIIVMGEISRASEKDSTALTRAADDHVRKLFWALWGPAFGHEVLTREQIEGYRGLARHIHETRKQGLYHAGPDAGPPRDAIGQGQAEELVALADARVGLARTRRWVQPDEDRARDLAWFIQATAEAQQRELIMGAKSMEKLAELRSVDSWMRWLREQFEESDRNAREHLEREMARGAPGAEEEAVPKWRLKVRFESASHSIRPRPLRWWNDLNTWIKLHPVSGRRHELIVEMTLPKAVSLDALWWIALGELHRLLVALNVGSMGFLWWEMPKRVERFYDELVDLDGDVQVEITRSPALRIGWGNRALSERELTAAALCLHRLPDRNETDRVGPINHYLTGLGFMAKTDVAMQFEANAFKQFLLALRGAARAYPPQVRDGDRGASTDILEELTGRLLTDETQRAKLRDAAAAVDAGHQVDAGIDLSDAATMKLLTDAFLLERFREAEGLGDDRND